MTHTNYPQTINYNKYDLLCNWCNLGNWTELFQYKSTLSHVLACIWYVYLQELNVIIIRNKWRSLWHSANIVVNRCQPGHYRMRYSESDHRWMRWFVVRCQVPVASDGLCPAHSMNAPQNRAMLASGYATRLFLWQCCVSCTSVRWW